MNLEIRSIQPDEFAEFSSVMDQAFGWDASEEDRRFWSELTEFDRTVVAFDGGTMVGTAGTISFELTVPGNAQIPAGGVTMVSVLPTHRRQGVLSALMGRQLAEIRDRGEPLAALWASESIIYGRFGYGMAIRNATWTIDRRYTGFARSTNPSGQVRLVDVSEAKKVLPDVHDEVRKTYPGMLSRPSGHWAWVWHDAQEHRDGASANRYVIYEEDGHALGAAVYRVTVNWADGFGANTVSVGMHLPVTDAAYEALWRHCFDLDLVKEIKARFRPAVEPLYWTLADPRRLRTRVSDGIWVRLVDLPAALTARTYQTEGRLVLGVEDGFLPDVGGTYVLEGGPDGAECAPTDAEPDLVLDAQALAAMYLGGNRVYDLHQGGRIDGEAHALRLADSMFGSDRGPWCPVMF